MERRVPQLVSIDGKLYAQSVLDCADCGSPMQLAATRFGVKYICTKSGCTGSLGAHSTGRPLGLPADTSTRKARIQAHAAFDKVWQHKRKTRTEAYAWLAATIGSPEPVHIAEMDKLQCLEVIEAVRNDFPDLFPFDDGVE